MPSPVRGRKPDWASHKLKCKPEKIKNFSGFLSIFAAMKNVAHIIYIILVSVSLMHFLYDGGMYESSFFQTSNCVHTECTDLSNHLEQIHSGGLEHEVLANKQFNGHDMPNTNIEYIPALNVSLVNSYTSSFWQPPKQS